MNFHLVLFGGDAVRMPSDVRRKGDAMQWHVAAALNRFKQDHQRMDSWFLDTFQ